MADPVDPPAPTGSNPCPVCGFLNTPDRVYCQDCGAKLEIAPPSYLKNPPPLVPASPPVASPSGIPAPEAKAAAPAATVSSKKPRILSANRGPSLLDRMMALLRPILYLAFVAVLAAILWPPAGIPAPADPISDATLAEIHTHFLETANRGSFVDAPWARLNAYLAGMLRPGKSSGFFSAAFVRAFLQPAPGGFRLTVEKRLMFLSIYTAVDYRLGVRDRHLSLVATGAGIGRLPLPAAAAPVVRLLSGNLDSALAADLDILRRAQVVRLSPTDVHIDFAVHRP